MKAIYASKLFRASPRQDKISAALNNPLNAELRKQLAIYLDEEYQEIEEEVEKNKMSAEVDEGNAGNDSDKTSKPSRQSGPASHSTSSSIPSMLDVDVGDPDTDEAEPDIETKDGQADNLDITDEMDEELRLDDDEDIQLATDIDTQVELSDKLSDDEFVELRNLLENDPHTCGVIRLIQKDDELWIYYSDETNLNSIMNEVMDRLDEVEIRNYEFNRLARTNNAIVFQIK